MFSIPGLLGLLIFVYLRPQEVAPVLKQWPLLYILFGLAVFGLAIDLGIGRLRLRAAPQLVWVVVLFFWTLVTVALQAPDRLSATAIELAIAIGLFVLIAHGVQSFRALRLVTGLLIALALFLAVIAIHQGLAPLGCARIDLLAHANDLSIGIPDGRPCATDLDCIGRDSGVEPGAEYFCEHVGLFGTTSIGEGRVRYRGILQDPNELALALGCALALAFAFAQRRSGIAHRVVLACAVVLVAIAIIMTGSRGGQLVFLIVLGGSFLQRVTLRHVLVAALLGLPILLFGGRGGAEADESAALRLDTWREALAMVRQHPLFGVGQDQFTQYHDQTAHNSYLLVAAELGLPGMLLWSIPVYLSIKIPLVGYRRYARVAGAEVARDWARALLVATVAMLVGIMFLSMSYHQMLWIYMGLCAAFYTAAASHDPEWRVTFGWRDLVLVLALDAAYLVLMTIYLALKA
jgi:O-antigen ligase